LSLGEFTKSPTLSKWGLMVQTPWGTVAVSVALALFTMVFLTHGLRLYVRVQKVLFYLTVAAIVTAVYIFATYQWSFAARLNEFVFTLVKQTGVSVPSGLAENFVSYLKQDVSKAGFNIAPVFSFLATLGIVPIAWTSLQWATYSVEQSTEIAEADRFGKQVWMLLFSAVVVTIALVAVAHYEHLAISKEFLVDVTIRS